MSSLRDRTANATNPKAAAAIKTLERMGYTYHGGELWKPPPGKSAHCPACGYDLAPTPVFRTYPVSVR